jgi:hypothetical protein
MGSKRVKGIIHREELRQKGTKEESKNEVLLEGGKIFQKGGGGGKKYSFRIKFRPLLKF